MGSDPWDRRRRRRASPRLVKERDEARKRRPARSDDGFDRIAETRAERRRAAAAVRLLAASDQDERLEARLADARRARRTRDWSALETRAEQRAERDRRRIADVGMRWFYHRPSARWRSPERYDDESLARHARALAETPSRIALPLALRWQRWLSRDLEFPSERLAFCVGVASCNQVVARMLAPRPELREALEGWIHRTLSAASEQELEEARWVTRLQGVW